MIPLWLVLTLGHLVGLSLGVGMATAKLTLLFKCRKNHDYIPHFLAVAKPITRFIILGLVLLTLSGIGWMIEGQAFTPLMITKLVLVAVLWGVGPIIDNVLHPRLEKLAQSPVEQADPGLAVAMNRYLAVEAGATAIFYITMVLGILL